MPKIKIKDWQGIFTDVDPNDSRLELVRSSTNVRHEPGFIEFEPRALAANSGLPTLETGFTWETGIYCVLASDELTDATAAVATSYNCLILVAKALSSGTYYRRIHLYDGTDWHELAKNSADISGIDIENDDNTANPPVMPEDFPESYFSTTLDQKAFFVIERGRAKLFLPHQSFWIGKIERTTLQSYLTHNDWYIDRLVEPYDASHQNILYNNVPVEEVPTGFTQSDTACSNGRRLGIAFSLDSDNDPTTTVESIPVDKTYVSTGFEDIGPTSQIQIKLLKYTFVNDDTDISIINPGGMFPPSSAGTENFYFIYETSTGNLCLPVHWADAFLLPDSTTWGAISTTKTSITADLIIGGSSTTGPITSTTGYYVITKANFDAQAFNWEGITIATVGFDVEDNAFELVVTAVIDDRDEVIIKSNTYELTVTSTFAISVSLLALPNDINKRITRVRFYFKLTKNPDFELVKEFDLLDGLESMDDFFISQANLSGTMLSANIGFLYEIDKSKDYKILTGFKSFASENDIGIGITTTDLIGIYHSTIGGGNLMTDILYSQNKVPVTGITNVKAVASINNKIGVFSDNTLYIIEVIDTSGLLTFTINDTIEYGVKNIDDVASIQGGVIVHTRNGIFYTNGFETELISLAINDTVRTNFSTGTIVYNKHKRELYYKPIQTGDDSDNIYRYRFERKVWELIDSVAGLAGEKVIVDQSGNQNWLTNTSLLEFDASDATTLAAGITMNTSDLGEPSIEKLMNYIDVDYQGGPINVTMLMGTTTVIKVLPLAGSRTTVFLDMPLITRKAFQKIGLSFGWTGPTIPTTKIFGIELDFDLIKRRRYN